MENIILTISRKNSLWGAAVPIYIRIRNDKYELFNGKSISVEIPNQQTIIQMSLWGNAINIHKTQKETVIFPNCCKEGKIICRVSLKPNYLGVMTGGLLRSTGSILCDIEYK